MKRCLSGKARAAKELLILGGAWWGSLEALFLLTAWADGDAQSHGRTSFCLASLRLWWLKTLGPVKSAWLVCYTVMEIPARVKLPFLKQHFSTCGPRSACATISLLNTDCYACLFTCYCLSPLLGCKPWTVETGLFTEYLTPLIAFGT